MYEAVSLLDHPRILFDREIVRVIDEITDGVEVNSDTLAFDMIKDLGQKGGYISLKETAKAYRTIMPRESILFEDGKPEGRKWRDPVEVARESVSWILENHAPEPLPEDVTQELSKIVATAENDENLQKEISGHK
jgi:trimethylamine--corrinoid protein Co-methyltransferase